MVKNIMLIIAITLGSKGIYLFSMEDHSINRDYKFTLTCPKCHSPIILSQENGLNRIFNENLEYIVYTCNSCKKKVSERCNTLKISLQTGQRVACATCSKHDKNNALYFCSRCRRIKYCSKECQTIHWPTHKISCNTLQDDEDKHKSFFELLNESMPNEPLEKVVTKTNASGLLSSIRYTISDPKSTADDKENAIKALLCNNPNIDAKDAHGITALMLACEKNLTNIAKLLIEHNADVNLKDNAGLSALMHNVWHHNNKEIVKLLIKNGADVTLKNNQLMTALEIARIKKRNEIVKLIKKAETLQLCNTCKDPKKKTSSKCPTCLTTYYCSKACQRTDWKNHKKVCGSKQSAYCNSCKNEAKSKCGRCQSVYYCSEKCQKKDWKNHKKICCEKEKN